MDDLDIFSAALELGAPDEREKYLSDVCGENLILHQRVEALFRSADESSQFLERPAAEAVGTQLFSNADDNQHPMVGDTVVMVAFQGVCSKPLGLHCNTNACNEIWKDAYTAKLAGPAHHHHRRRRRPVGLPNGVVDIVLSHHKGSCIC